MGKWLKKQFRSPDTYIAAAALCVIIAILFIKPIAGVANNGDYERVMKPAGIQFITDSRFLNLDQHFKMTGTAFAYVPGKSYISSHLLPVLAARILNAMVKSREVFDIRFLGLVYGAIFIIGFFLLVKGNKTGSKAINALMAVLLLFVLCDVGYISYFNSFLGEAPVIVFFLLMFGVISCIIKSKKVSIPLLLCFYISALLFISAKQSNVPAGILTALFGFAFLLIDRRKRIVSAICISTVILFGATIFLYSSAPQGMEMITKHQTVFYGILKDSPTPEKDLEDLGLDKSLVVLKEAGYYDADLPIRSDSEFMKTRFYNRISFSDIVKFYLLHPSRLIEKMEVTAQSSTTIRTPYLGNLKFSDTGERLAFSSKFDVWSTLKKIYMPHSLLFVATFFILFLTALIYELYRALKISKDRFKAVYICMFLLLWLTGATQFVIPIIGDGEVDLVKHMFLYNACFDLMFISSVIWITARLISIVITYKSRIINKKALPIVLPLLVSLAILAIVVIDAQGGTRTLQYSKLGLSSAARIGDRVEFGSYGGKELTWRIIGKDNESIMLIADDIVCMKPFDAQRTDDKIADRQKYGSNNWETSALRAWLNSAEKTVNYTASPDAGHVWNGLNAYSGEPGFLYGFTGDERNAIKAVRHKSILSTFDKGSGDGGSMYYLWTNCLPLLMQNYDNAWYRDVEDLVFLPDVRDLKESVYDNGLGVKMSGNYWLRTPYATRASFVRYVGTDGYVYHKDAYYGNMGVVPVLRLKR